MRRLPARVTPAIALVALLALALSNPHADLTQPAPPVLREPPPGETVPTLTFTWDPVPEAARYEIEVRAMQAGMPVEPPVLTATTFFTTITPRDTGGFPQGDFSWQVRAVDSEGQRSAWGQSQFTYRIHAPAPLAPADGASLTAGQPTQFAWTAAAGARAYRIEVATDTSFSNVLWSATTSDTSIIPPYPIGTGELYWRVTGLAPGGHPGPASPVRHFTRGVGVPRNLVGPEGAAPAFLWDGVAGATSYNIQVSAVPDFSETPLWEADTVNHSIAPVSTSFGSQTRHWRIRARDAGGFTGPWAEGQPFILNSPGGVETLELQSPPPDAILQEDPAFRWQRLEGADSYVLEVSTSPTFDSLYDQVETRYNAYTPFTTLIQTNEHRRETYANGVYYWRVRALIGSGRDVLSEEWRFTKAATISLLGPASGSAVVSDPTFQWSRMAGAHHYALILSTTAAFEPILHTVQLGNTSHIPYAIAGSDPDTYANNTYFWKIDALGSDDTKLATSAAASFVKNTPLYLVAPADGAVRQDAPTFVWSSVPGAYRYRLTVWSAPDFMTVYDQIATDATRYTPYAGELAKSTYADGEYRWTVEALDSLGQVITTSASRRLTIGTATATPAPSPTWTSTPSPSATPTWTPSPTRTASPTATPSLTPSPSPSPTVTSLATTTRTPTTVPPATATVTASPSPSPAPTEGATHTPSPTITPGPSPTAGWLPPSPTPPPDGRIDTDEPNDYWTLAAPLQPGTHQSYISHERDLDWFKVWVDQPRSRLRIALIRPPADYDLVLLGDPADTLGTLQGIGALVDVGAVAPTGQLRAAEDLGDVGTLEDARPVRAISARRGWKSETVMTNILQQPGWYYVLVKGYNGARSHQPYTFDVAIDPPANSRHCTVEPPYPPGVIIARWAATEAPQTLILVNKRRMDTYYGSGSRLSEQLLQTFASHPRVNGIVEPVENVSEVADMYDAWDDDACNPDAANRVTEAIKRHIDDLRVLYPTIEQVLIVGNDDIIPFHRVPDEVSIGNEQEYLPAINANPDSPFYSALEQGYVLTDDFYVDDEPLAWRGRRLYVPDRPVGRLVETPAEIANAIETFLDIDGRLSVETGLVLGYDYSAASSERIADTLQSAGVIIQSMIATNWTGADLRDSLLNTHHDANAVNARFSHNEAIAPDESGGPLTAEAVSEVGGELTPSLFFSMGSHAGLNVPDRWAGIWDRLDFSQALTGRGVASVINTGYAYGVAGADDYSELIATYFTQELTRTPDVSVGQALTRAKQRFFREVGPASFSLYHEKALIEAALFGIPSLRVMVPNLATPSGNSKQVAVGSMKVAGDNLFTRRVRLEPSFERVDTPLGTYLRADDGTVSRPGRPVQPRFTWDIQEPELLAHGALWVAGSYTDLLNFDPVIARPLTDTTGPEPAFPFNVWTPARLHAINRLSTADGTTERLIVIPAQFKNAPPVETPGLVAQSGAEPSFGVERRYDALTYEVYYSTSSDWVPPTIWSVRYRKTALGAEFWVDVTDPSGIERVVVTYTTGNGEWETAELQLVEGFSWQALMPFFEPEELDFVAQAVDSAGNVAVSADKGRLFGRRSATMYLAPLMR